VRDALTDAHTARQGGTLNALDRFERLVTGVLEGTVARALGARLEPVEIARRIDRAMDDSRVVSPGQPIVPNRYVVALHPEDLASLGEAQSVIAQELAAYVANRASERRWLLAGRAHVELVAAPTQRSREITVTAQIATDSARQRAASRPTEVGQTQRFPTITPASRAEPEKPEPPASPTVQRVLVGRVGSGVRLVLDQPVVRIGRALDNDLVLEDSRVSRYHLEILRDKDTYVVRDLGSTNGTLVNGKAVRERRLKVGDLISVGGLDLRFS